ncbi:hypothetical protein PG994_008726 [Apiospora phragmitis]|uniref:NmrA-like domain-containing protein n=1 Tax=Apiospora phragmitis TaxID=2905665 RepID=A0ABR1UK64_9PEZI
MTAASPTPTKTIAMVGATGHQGSSVAQTFLALRPHWHVRTLTRNPTSPAARKLAAQGAEVVQADLESSSSPSLEAAFAGGGGGGVHAAFLNTDFWAPYRAALARGETQYAASCIGFETEMRPALAPLREASGGRYTHSYHWDSKAAAAAWIASAASGVADKASFIYVGAYSTNPLLLPQKMTKKKAQQQGTTTGAEEEEEEEYVVRLPAGRGMRMPVLDITASTGPFDEPPNTNLLAYDEYLDVDGLMRAWFEAVVDTGEDDNDATGSKKRGYNHRSPGSRRWA